MGTLLLTSLIVSQNWHTMFDAGKWAMVPEEPVRKEILSRLVEIKNKEKAKGSSGGISVATFYGTLVC